MFTIEKSKLWFDRIIECRSSGLCDAQWCRENNIKSPTFYYWVKKLRIERSSKQPEATALSLRKEQEIIPIQITEDVYPTPSFSSPKKEQRNNSAIAIEMDSFTIHIQNSASPLVIQATLQALKQLC